MVINALPISLSFSLLNSLSWILWFALFDGRLESCCFSFSFLCLLASNDCSLRQSGGPTQPTCCSCLCFFPSSSFFSVLSIFQKNKTKKIKTERVLSWFLAGLHLVDWESKNLSFEAPHLPYCCCCCYCYCLHQPSAAVADRWAPLVHLLQNLSLLFLQVAIRGRRELIN